jgi:hydrophobic/amphiphilic exporter-1 (mainly G- bacteria), HAE1 family
MRIARISIDRPVTTAMVFLAVVLLGFVSLRRLSVDLLPDIGYPRLSVVTRFPGVAPEEMETLITVPLEAAVSRISGLRGVDSVSREGISFLTLEFAWGTDMDFVLLHTREELDNAREGLPLDAENPAIIPLDPGAKPILVLAVTGDRSLLELREICEEVIKPRLEQIGGIGSADIAGGAEREIQIALDPALVSLYGLSLDDISRRIDAFNRDLQGGTIRKGRFQYALRVAGEFADVVVIGETSLKTTGKGGVVRLKDIARIVDSIKERQGLARLDGRESVGVLVRKASGANTVRVTRAAKSVLEEIIRENPAIGIHMVSEQGRFIEEAVAATMDEIVEGGILAFLVLLLFLQELRTPIIIGIVFPVAIVATFNLLYFGGITLNIMSLGGLALGVGMLDDCAVVVSENIFRHRSLGKGPAEAAEVGTREVGIAVTATALTTIVVFLPVIYVHGVAGRLFRDAALTLTFSLMSSLLVSLTLLPMLAGRGSANVDGGGGTGTAPVEAPGPTAGAAPRRACLKRLPRMVFKGFGVAIGFVAGFVLQLAVFALNIVSLPFRPVLQVIARSFNKSYERFVVFYHHALIRCLEHKEAVLALFLVFFGLMTFTGTQIRRELMPRLETSSFEVSLRTPVTYSLDETAGVIASLEKWLGARPETRLTYSQIGLVGGMEALDLDVSLNSARIVVETSSPSACGRLIEKFGRTFQAYTDVAFSVTRERSDMARSLALSGAEIGVEVRGDDLDRLGEIATAVASRLKGVPGIADINVDLGEGKPEFVLRIRDDVLAKYPGLEPGALGDRIVDSVRGRVATRLRELDRSYDVRIRLDEGTETNVESLLDGLVPCANAMVPLRELVIWEIARGPREIRRADQQREVLVTAGLRGAKPSQVAPRIQQAIAATPLPPGYRIVFGGEREEMRESFRSLIAAFLLAILLNYMIMAAQFESLLHPLIILTAVPMGLCGSILAMLLTGTTMNVISIIGMVVLLGIVVDNAIVKLDYTNQLRKQGMGLREAIVEGSRVRLRPILMSTATTLVALIPLSLGIGKGAELLQPLGIVVLGGLTFSTLLTLFLIPVIYEIVEARKETRRRTA